MSHRFWVVVFSLSFVSRVSSICYGLDVRSPREWGVRCLALCSEQLDGECCHLQWPLSNWFSQNALLFPLSDFSSTAPSSAPDLVADHLENSIWIWDMIPIFLIHAEPSRVEMGEAGWSVPRLPPPWNQFPRVPALEGTIGTHTQKTLLSLVFKSSTPEVTFLFPAPQSLSPCPQNAGLSKTKAHYTEKNRRTSGSQTWEGGSCALYF